MRRHCGPIRCVVDRLPHWLPCLARAHEGAASPPIGHSHHGGGGGGGFGGGMGHAGHIGGAPFGGFGGRRTCRPWRRPVPMRGFGSGGHGDQKPCRRPTTVPADLAPHGGSALVTYGGHGGSHLGQSIDAHGIASELRSRQPDDPGHQLSGCHPLSWPKRLRADPDPVSSKTKCGPPLADLPSSATLGSWFRPGSNFAEPDS